MAGPYPPAVPFPERRSRRRLIVGLALGAAAAAVLTLAVVYGVRTNGANSGAAVSDSAARTAIQGYLDALEKRDIDGITRNALCGMYDAVRDKRSDEALARLIARAAGDRTFYKKIKQAVQARRPLFAPAAERRGVLALLREFG